MDRQRVFELMATHVLALLVVRVSELGGTVGHISPDTKLLDALEKLAKFVESDDPAEEHLRRIIGL